MTNMNCLAVVVLMIVPLTVAFGADYTVLPRSARALVLHDCTAADRVALDTLSASGTLEKLVLQLQQGNAKTTKASGYGTFEGFRQRFVSACLTSDVEQVLNYCQLPIRGTAVFTETYETISTCSQFAMSFERLFTKQVVQILMNAVAEKRPNGTIHLACILNEYDEDEGMIIESSLIFVFKPVRDTFRLVEVIPVG